MNARLMLLAGLCAWPVWAERPLPDLKAVMGQLDDLYRAESSHSKLKMKVVTEFYDRELTLESWSKGDQHALLVVRAPAREAGTATLRNPDGLWSYAARADRLVRIPSGMLSESWMGSHLSNDDLVRETDFEKDYETQLSWVTENQALLLAADMKPKPDAPVVFSRIRYLLDPAGWVPVRAEYYDGDKVARTTTFSGVKELRGKKVPMVMTVVPADKPKEFTRMEYLDLQLGAEVTDSMFTARGLRREAGK